MSLRLRKLYRWLRDGFGSSVVASSWVLLWLLWPMAKPAAPRAAPGPAAAFSYVRVPTDSTRFRVMPDQFARAPLAGLGIADRIEGLMSEAPEPELPRPDLLERSPEDASRGMRLDRGSLTARLEGLPARHRYVALGGPVFGTGAARTTGVHVAVSPELAARGFALPSPGDLPGKWQKKWMVRAYLDVSPGGWVDHVLLETPCEDGEVNAMLTLYLQRGEVSKAGRALSGRVTVSFAP